MHPSPTACPDPFPFRSDLLPARALLEVARVLKAGSERYGVDAWRRIPAPEHLNHALTHLLALLASDTAEPHLTHAACRLLFALDLGAARPGGGAHGGCVGYRMPETPSDHPEAGGDFA
jgi:hypothetical protein